MSCDYKYRDGTNPLAVSSHRDSMPEPTSIQSPCRIALIMNGNSQIPKRAYHWSLQLLDTTNDSCVCKYHVVGTIRNFVYDPNMSYDLAASQYVYLPYFITDTNVKQDRSIQPGIGDITARSTRQFPWSCPCCSCGQFRRSMELPDICHGSHISVATERLSPYKYIYRLRGFDVTR